MSAMFAVVKTGGKQYRVAPGDLIKVEKRAGEPGETIALDHVLMLGAEVGTPQISGACVMAEVLDQRRADKVIVFKKKRRHNYRRRKGHRQYLTMLRVTDIQRDGSSLSAVAVAEAPATESEAKSEA